MCGIAGTYRWPGGEKVADALSASIQHRGPDGSGAYDDEPFDAQVCLRHRRLSIIDLSDSGAQPMTRDGLCLIYNGELYNYLELRAELKAHGANFVGSSDTEVVIQAWRHWGIDCLPRLRGMFAFAIYDRVSGELFLARDQLGIKPLYMVQRNGQLAFASELKALAGVLGSTLTIDRGALVASLLYYWVPDSRCAYQEVQKLPPGSWFSMRPDGSTKSGRYWCARDAAQWAQDSPGPPLGDVIADSTRRHLLSDVPVATFLSGGLDSSYLTALAAEVGSVDAYTISFRPADARFEAMPDDLRYARLVAKQFGVPLHEIEVDPGVLDVLPKMVHHLDEPIGDPAAINTFLICSAARAAGAKVLLSGMGADELFAGYRKHVANLLAVRYRRVPRPLRRTASAAVARMPVATSRRGLRSVRFAKRFLTFADLPEETAFRRSYTLYGRLELLDLVSPDLAGEVDRVIEEHAVTYHDQDLKDHVNRMCLTDARLFLPGHNLAYTDRASMAASTEVRVPFVDVEVFQAAFRLTGAEKVAGRQTKAALKSAAAGLLPDSVIHRPKGLFSAPLRAWMSRDLAPVLREVITEGEVVTSGLLRPEALQRLADEDANGIEDRSKHLWHVLTLEYWLREARSSQQSHGRRELTLGDA